MLHHAYYWRERAPQDPAEGSVQRYVMSWGRPGDAAVIAYSDNGNVGAAWYRLFKEREPGYGFVDEQTPEVTIAVVPSHRGKGTGGELLDALLERARADGFSQLSLSAELGQTGFYEKYGFRELRREDGTVTMVASL
jgi:GNAT superfamily N-acetyltransferase